MKTLIIDNYDSFTFNLYQYLGELGGNPVVFRNDEITLRKIKLLKPSHIVISPGPGSPENEKDFGVSREVIEHLGPTTPLLGVCLGHQGIIMTFGGTVAHAPEPVHGKTCEIRHTGEGIFRSVKNPLTVMRYHSLIGDRKNFPSELTITAETDDQLIMAIQHCSLPIFGIQFHPESIGTEQGKKILKNFLSVRAPTIPSPSGRGLGRGVSSRSKPSP